MFTKPQISVDFEKRAIDEGFQFIAGVDEVGRGCLAGAVVAAAVILDLSKPIPAGLNDSKKLSAKKRAALNEKMRLRLFTLFTILPLLPCRRRRV